MYDKKISIVQIISIIFFVAVANEFLKITSMYGSISQRIVIDTLANYIVFFLLGVIISLENIFEQRNKNGKWSIDYFRLIFAFLPCLLIIIVKLIWFLGFYSLPNYLASIQDIQYHILSVISGYMFFTSFYKESN